MMNYRLCFCVNDEERTVNGKSKYGDPSLRSG